MARHSLVHVRTPLLWLAIVLAVLVAADALDTVAALVARTLPGWESEACDYVIPMYDVSPGWFVGGLLRP